MMPANPVQHHDPRPPTPTPAPRDPQPVGGLTSLRLSSPVAPDSEEDEMMSQFGYGSWAERRKTLIRSKSKLLWTSSTVRCGQVVIYKMSDSSSEFYKIASAKGIPDGILRELRKDLHEFKEIWRAGSALGDLGRR